jgi:hypothetical protein
METIFKYGSWLGWTVFYLFRPQPKELGGFLIKAKRTWKPWAKFIPHVYHCDYTGDRRIYLADERSYTTRMTLDLSVMVGADSGNIVGLTIRADQMDLTTPPEQRAQRKPSEMLYMRLNSFKGEQEATALKYSDGEKLDDGYWRIVRNGEDQATGGAVMHLCTMPEHWRDQIEKWDRWGNKNL